MASGHRAASRRAVRLPSGQYAWRGRAARFSHLPQAEKHRLRSGWSRKAARTTGRTRRAAGADVVVVPGEADRKLARTWTADRAEGQTVGHVIEAVRQAGRAAAPPGERGAGSWIAIVEWPKDERSEPGQPYRTTVSFPIRSHAARDHAREFRLFLEQVERAGADFLDRQKSGAQGKAVIVSVEWMLFTRRGRVPRE